MTMQTDDDGNLIAIADGYAIGCCGDDCPAIHLWLMCEKEKVGCRIDMDADEIRELIRKLEVELAAKHFRPS